MSTYDESITATRYLFDERLPPPRPEAFVAAASEQLRDRRRRVRIARVLLGCVWLPGLYVLLTYVVAGLGQPGPEGLRALTDAKDLAWPTVALMLAGWMLGASGGRAQVVAKALLWFLVPASLVLEGLLMTSAASTGWEPALLSRASILGVTVFCCSAALLLARHGALSPRPDDTFRPVAFRGLLTLAMVLALGDAFVLVWGASLGLSLWPLFLGLVMVACAEGLYRLKVWALFATWLANPLVIAALWLPGMLQAEPSERGGAMLHLFDPSYGSVVPFLVATTLVQLLLPLPVIVAILRGRVRQRPRLAAQTTTALRVGLVAVAVLALVAPALAWAIS